MSRGTLIIAMIALASLSACGPAEEPDEPRERFEQPYEDRVKEIEAEQLRRARDQLKEADRQSGGKDEDDDRRR